MLLLHRRWGRRQLLVRRRGRGVEGGLRLVVLHLLEELARLLRVRAKDRVRATARVGFLG